MDRSYSRTELDNYKLQVELLEEKLQRSEEHRNQLEQKLEQILRKRSEHDKASRARARQRYQQFLEEQQKRSERNEMLVQMLERIDEQSAALAARSERLKMMKLQYETYFAKLVQTQTMRCMQQSAAAAAAASIPLLLPRELPFQGNEHALKAASTANPPPTTHQIGDNTIATPYDGYQRHNDNANRNTSIPSPVTPRHWTPAPGTPTADGLLLTSTAAPPAPAALQDPAYPVGYFVPPLHFAHHQQHRAPAANDPHAPQRGDVADEPSAVAADNAQLRTPKSDVTCSSLSDAIARSTQRRPSATERPSFDGPNNNSNSARRERPESAAPAAPSAAAPSPSALPSSSPSASASASASASMTATSTSLAFDKLLSAHGSSKTSWRSSAAGATAAGVGEATAAEASRAAGFAADDASLNPRNFVKTDNGDKNNNNVSSKKVTAVSDAAAAAAAADVADNDVDDVADVVNTLRRQQINKDLAATATLTATTVTEQPRRETVQETTTLSTTKAAADFADDINGGDTRPAAERVEPETIRSSVESTVMTIQQHGDVHQAAAPTATTTVGSYQHPQFERREKMSIERIENTIYGERVGPLAADAESGEEAAFTAASGLLSEFAGSEGRASEEVAAAATADPEEAGADESEPQSARGSGDHEVSSAELNSTDAPPLYVEGGEGDYAAQETLDHQQQPLIAAELQPGGSEDYAASYDYPDYDAAAYQAAYDSTAYPGYTYDEASGQYVADEDTQRYAEAGYVQQGSYDASAQQQQPQDEEDPCDYSRYQTGEGSADAAAAFSEPQPTPSTAPSADHQQSADAQAAPVKKERTQGAAAPAAPFKPTSILSTEKPAAANDAQQGKKKKRVIFVESSETEDSSGVKPAGAAGAASSESDFDFSSTGPSNN